MSWDSEWFKKDRDFWSFKENQLEFLVNLQKDFKIKKPEDWGKITNHQFIEHGGGSLLSLYENSMLKMLRSSFPGT